MSAHILTTYVHPPIPLRDCDWLASFPGEEEGIVGRGETEHAAIADLREQANDRLIDAAQCAANVLFLLDTEVAALGCNAKNVLPNLLAAISAATSQQGE